MYYCPKCATQNAEDAKFCRRCGTDIRLVPQAMSGRLPGTEMIGDMFESPTGSEPNRSKRKKEPNLKEAVSNLSIGLAFLFVSISVWLFAPAGRIWWFWLLIPAFACLGNGIAEFMRLKQAARPALPLVEPLQGPSHMPAKPHLNELSPGRATAEMNRPPASITEETTRRFGMNVERPKVER